MNNAYPPSPYLNVIRLPARLNKEQAAAVLGFAPHDLQVLIRAKKLKPLGSGAPNRVKYFAAVEIEKLRHDERWLDEASSITGRSNKNPKEATISEAVDSTNHFSRNAR